MTPSPNCSARRMVGLMRNEQANDVVREWLSRARLDPDTQADLIQRRSDALRSFLTAAVPDFDIWSSVRRPNPEEAGSTIPEVMGLAGGFLYRIQAADSPEHGAGFSSARAPLDDVSLSLTEFLEEGQGTLLRHRYWHLEVRLTALPMATKTSVKGQPDSLEAFCRGLAEALGWPIDG